MHEGAAQDKRSYHVMVAVFNLHLEKEQGALLHPRTWLVVANSLFEAMSVLPDGFAVKSIEVQVGTVVDPRRVIRPVDAPVAH